MAEGLEQPKEAFQAIQKLQRFAQDNPDFTLQQIDNLPSRGNPIKPMFANANLAIDTLIQAYKTRKELGNAEFLKLLKDEINYFLTDRTASSDPTTLGDLLQGKLGKINFQQGVAEGYQFKGSFPFDVDHMHGGRGINLPKAETKKYFTDKKQWQRAVDDINSSKYDDNSDYIGVTGRSTVEINGREWARWSDAQQKGYIELSSMSEQGVAEAATPASVSKVLRLIDRRHPEWFDNYGMGEVEDTVVDMAEIGQFQGMSAEDALALVGQELESLYGQQGVAEGYKEERLKGCKCQHRQGDNKKCPIHGVQEGVAEGKKNSRNDDHDRLATGTNESRLAKRALMHKILKG